HPLTERSAQITNGRKLYCTVGSAPKLVGAPPNPDPRRKIAGGRKRSSPGRRPLAGRKFCSSLGLIDPPLLSSSRRESESRAVVSQRYRSGIQRSYSGSAPRQPTRFP